MLFVSSCIPLHHTTTISNQSCKENGLHDSHLQSVSVSHYLSPYSNAPSLQISNPYRSVYHTLKALERTRVAEGLQVRGGVRAVPARTTEGAPPLLGMLERASEKLQEGPRSFQGCECSWWLLTGLGVRGLLYHSLMAEWLAAAIRARSQDGLPLVVRRWQQPQ